MEFMKLDPTTYRPVDMIDDYDSLIFTQRYQAPGDFEMVTPHIEDIMLKLPLGSLVTHNDTEEFMMVENYEIEEDDDGAESLKVSGRSFTAYMENRIALDDYEWYYNYDNTDPLNPTEDGVHAWLIQPGATPWNDADAAAHIMAQHLVYGVFKSFYGINPEQIPGLTIQQQDPTNRRYYAKYIERGNLLEGVTALIKAGQNGVRSVRPSSSLSGIILVLYKGIDRTTGQTANPRVVLDVNQGHMTGVKYFQSIKDWKNSARVFGTHRRPYINPVWTLDGTGVADPSRMGWGFRDFLVDATEITGISFQETDAALHERLRSELAKKTKINIVSAKVSNNIPYQFFSHYYLGDIVTVRGNFNIEQSMRVTEYIRTEDRNGEVAYPALSIL